MWKGDDGDKCEDFADYDVDNDDDKVTCSSTPPSHMFFFSRVIPRKADIH